jgi:hypothetical protein
MFQEVNMSEANNNKPVKTNDSLRESFTFTRPDPKTQAPTLRRNANSGPVSTDASTGAAKKH